MPTSPTLDAIFAAYEAGKNLPVTPPSNYPVGSNKRAQAIQTGYDVRTVIRNRLIQAGYVPEE